MADILREILSQMAHGLKDCLLGTVRVCYLDKDSQEEVGEDATSDFKDQPTSTLARRRAERTRHREQKADKRPKLKQRLLLCCAWNGGVCLLSWLVFEYALFPCLKFLTHVIVGGSARHSVVWYWISFFLSWTFNALWILPLFVLSKIVNSLWFQDIADIAYRKSRGRPQLLPSVSKLIADTLFSVLMQSLFLIQGMLFSQLPIAGLGGLLYLLHMCLLYSVYAFEYKWFNMGREVHKRLSYIENNWPYFVGFGLPLALLTSLFSSFVVSGCLFSMLFPLFIVSANEAEPVHHTFDYPLRLFSPVVSLSNAIFQHSVKKTQQSSSSSPSRTKPPTKHIKLVSIR